MSDPAFIAVLLVSVVVAIGFLIYFLAIERSLTHKITKAVTGARNGVCWHFECTCGWHGWRTCAVQPVSIKCPMCNGVAVQLNYREREL